MTKQFKTNFKSFCEFTSLHGWHYMVDSECGRSTFKKIFWGFIVIFSMATASFFLYANTWVSFQSIIRYLFSIILYYFQNSSVYEIDCQEMSKKFCNSIQAIEIF